MNGDGGAPLGVTSRAQVFLHDACTEMKDVWGTSNGHGKREYVSQPTSPSKRLQLSVE